MSFYFLLSKLRNFTPYLRFNICFNKIPFRDKNLDSNFSNIIKYINKNLVRKTKTTIRILSRKEYWNICILVG